MGTLAVLATLPTGDESDLELFDETALALGLATTFFVSDLPAGLDDLAVMREVALAATDFPAFLAFFVSVLPLAAGLLVGALPAFPADFLCLTMAATNWSLLSAFNWIRPNVWPFEPNRSLFVF